MPGGRVAVTGGYGYLLSDNADLKGWQRWLRDGAGEDFAEYADIAAASYRGASFAGDRIEACLFMGPRMTPATGIW
jgi:assimilatory nitrate reductase catalytic subunit